MADPVTDYYNRNPEGEWNRLFASPYRRVEFEVVHYFLTKYLPPAGKILDLGGGPGRYTISLAKQGYRMALVDLAPSVVEFARKKIAAAGVQKQVDALIVGDGRDLRWWADDAFDAVLCMGPLYHLPQPEDRLRCLRECARLAKPGAPLFVTVIPRCTFIRDALRSGGFEDVAQQSLKALEEIFERGTSAKAEVPNMYFCRPEEIGEWLDASGFELLELASTHGFAAFMDEKINVLGKNAETWNVLMKMILATCADPASFAAAEHLIGVGRRKG